MTNYDLRIWEEWRAVPAGMSRELWRSCGGVEKKERPAGRAAERSKSFCGCLRICGVANVLLPAGGLRGCG